MSEIRSKQERVRRVIDGRVRIVRVSVPVPATSDPHGAFVRAHRARGFVRKGR